MAKKPSFETIQKVINKLNSELGFDLEPDTEFMTYSGRADAGAYRWSSLNLSPEINSDLTMSEFLKAKAVGYDYVSWNNEGVFVTNEKYNPQSKYMNKPEKPEFKKIDRN